ADRRGGPGGAQSRRECRTCIQRAQGLSRPVGEPEPPRKSAASSFRRGRNRCCSGPRGDTVYKSALHRLPLAEQGISLVGSSRRPPSAADESLARPPCGRAPRAIPVGVRGGTGVSSLVVELSRDFWNQRVRAIVRTFTTT